jgi:hypothetical protein
MFSITPIDLNRKLVALEGEVLDLTRDNRRLESKVEELEIALRLKKALEFKEPFYWLEGDNTPYCPACWEKTHQAVHVVKAWSEEGRTGWDCPCCKNRIAVGAPNAALRY